jgi:hypothetical protein
MSRRILETHYWESMAHSALGLGFALYLRNKKPREHSLKKLDGGSEEKTAAKTKNGHCKAGPRGQFVARRMTLA